jgi:hypothetical protein
MVAGFAVKNATAGGPGQVSPGVVVAEGADGGAVDDGCCPEGAAVCCGAPGGGVCWAVVVTAAACCPAGLGVEGATVEVTVARGVALAVGLPVAVAVTWAASLEPSSSPPMRRRTITASKAMIMTATANPPKMRMRCEPRFMIAPPCRTRHLVHTGKAAARQEDALAKALSRLPARLILRA